MLLIHYETSSHLVANAIIFDCNGRKIKQIAESVLLGQSGALSWDGRNNAGLKCNIGIYIVYIETIDTKGKIETYKLPCTLAKRF